MWFEEEAALIYITNYMMCDANLQQVVIMLSFCTTLCTTTRPPEVLVALKALKLVMLSSSKKRNQSDYEYFPKLY